MSNFKGDPSDGLTAEDVRAMVEERERRHQNPNPWPAREAVAADHGFRPPNNMSDQEIRARALECACRLPPPLNSMSASSALEAMFWETVRDFEAYIRGDDVR